MNVQLVRTSTYHSNSSILKRKNPLILNTKKISKENFSSSHCRCPRILCCDDEAYQHFILKKLLELSDSSSFSKETCFCYSGEELIEKYKNLRTCSTCGGPEIIISDYNMGNSHMDGIDTLLKIRELGFGGLTILRTSTSIESLTDDHMDLEEHIEKKDISFYIAKQNVGIQKQIFKEFKDKNH